VSSLPDFDLSRNKSLRILEVPASSISCKSSDGSPDPASRFLKHVLSTITSTAFFEIIVLYWDCDFRGVTWHTGQPHFRELPQAVRTEEASRNHRRFEVLREMHKVRDFQLVLSATVPGCMGEYLMRMLEEAVAEEKAKKGFDDFFPEPLVLYNAQRTRPGG